MLFISFIVLLRLAELLYSRRNEKWLLQHGAVEYGRDHYPLIVGLHILFFISLILEYFTQDTPAFSLPLIITFLVLTAFKAWVVAGLGPYWCTRIYRIPHVPLIKTGIYKYFRHPNYTIVILEIFIIPMAFNLYYTAISFSLLNAAVLYVRISEENKALNG